MPIDSYTTLVLSELLRQLRLHRPEMPSSWAPSALARALEQAPHPLSVGTVTAILTQLVSEVRP